MLRPALRVLLVLALALAPALARGDVFRWVDELGVTHFTTDPDSIPRAYRDEAVAIGTLPAPAKRRAAAAPAAAPAPETAPAPAASVPEAVAPEIAPPAAAPSATASPAPDVAPDSPEAPALSAPPTFPGPPAQPTLSPDDPRASEVAELEAQIASDREKLRQMISTKRWDSAELASDPEIREIAERLPRLQAQLAALQAEPAP